MLDPALEMVVRAALDEIKDPCSVASGTPLGLDEMGLVDSVSMSESGVVDIRLRLTSPFCHMIGFFKVEAERRVSALAGVTGVRLDGDNGLDWSPTMISAEGQAKRAVLLKRLQESQSAATA